MFDGEVNFLDLDLNLLISLDALLAERSVTKAAERLHRSQPALSASLKRLRRQFRDDLLTRVGNQYELTPLATQLQSRIGLVLADVERLFGMRARFDETRSDREFVIVTSDYGLTVLGTAVTKLIAERAPSVRLRFVPVSERVVDNAQETLRAVDGLFLPHGFLRGIPHIDAHTDRWVFLVSSDHSCGDVLSRTELTDLPWVLAFNRPGANLPAVRQLQMMGVDMNVAVAIDTFLAMPEFLQGTDRVALIQEKLAKRLAAGGGMRIVESPYDLMPLVEAFWWHATLEHDPGHIWLRSIVEEAGEALGG